MLDSLLHQSIHAGTPEPAETNDVAEQHAFYTAELVSPSDSLVSSPRPPLAGAVGEIVCPPNSAILELREVHEDPEDIDHVSVTAEPYGSSRSTTIDDQPVGEAPDGRLGDQLAFMMQSLSRNASTSTFGHSSTPTNPQPHPEQLARKLVTRDEDSERPRLWSIRPSSQNTEMSLPVTPIGTDDGLDLTL